MTIRSFVVAAAVVLSATLVNPSDSAAQRQRWPGGNGGGRQQEGGGGGRERQHENGGGPRENGGGPQRENGGGPRRENGGGQQRDDGAARPQGGGGRAQVRAAQPRADQGNPGDSGPSTALRAGRRERPAEAQNIAPPPQQVQSTPAPQTRSDAGSSNDGRVVRRRYPTEADRANVNGSTVIADGNSRAIARSPGNGGGDVRANTNTSVRSGSRVAVPRVGPPPGYYHDKGYYDSRYYSRGYYTYRHNSHGNIYVVPYGRTYYYYPRYYYNPYAFGYGPAGYGHVYFDLSYNSYVWHPYSVYRNDTYGNYGYPVGELRLKVQPRDAQVYIDGYYAGRVDDFDGIFQSLKLEEGEYQVEIVLPGFEPLAFNVRIYPGQKTTYEGDLIREP